MKKILSSTLFVIALVAVGALAFLSLNGAPVAAVPGQSVDTPQTAPAALAPEAPAATNKWNAIAMALDNTATLNNAQALAGAIDGTQQLLKWDANLQSFQFYIPDPVFPGGFGTNFALVVGGAYMVSLDNTAASVFSLVGDVPPQSGDSGAVQFSVPGGSPCKWSFISLPLDHESINNAQELADSIGNVDQLIFWNANDQQFSFYIPNPIFPGGFGSNFATNIGYPYFVCLSSAKTWP